MLINPFEFDRLICPIKYDDFIEKYWEKKPLILNKRKSQGYCDLINLQDVNSLLFSTEQKPIKSSPRVLVSKRTKNAHPIEPQINNETGLLNKDKLLDEYKDGSTIVLYNQEDLFKPLATLCREMEQTLGHPTRSVIFLTPPNADGFKAHYDKFNTFVLQIEGKKLWKIYEDAIPFPIISNPTPFLGKSPSPYREIELKPGDFLYLPRGHVHETSTTNAHSLHVTLAIDVFTWADLLHEMMKNEPELRRALPIKAMLSKNAQNIDLSCIKTIEKVLSDSNALDHAFRKIYSKYVKVKKTTYTRDFNARSFLKEITSETILRKREEIFYSLVTEYDRTTLYFGNEEITGPSNIEPSLQYILDNDLFSVKCMPNTMTESSNMVLVNTLLKEDFLVIAD